MGLWGKISSPFKGAPSRGPVRQYEKDPYARGYGKRGAQADEATHKLLMEELARTPGYTDEEYRMISEVPIEAQRRGESRQLRTVNRAAGAAGQFGGGSRARASGRILSGGMRQRSQIRMQAPAMKAQFARADRQSQIRTGSGYSLPRQGISQAETGQRNMFAMGLNQMDMQEWITKLNQYNQDYGQGMGYLKGGSRLLGKIMG